MHNTYTRYVTYMALIAALTVGVSAAYAQQVVASIKPLLTQAIERGQARGVLGGAAADFLRSKFGTDQPVLIDVEVVGNHREAGCKRLRVVTHQAGVVEHLKDGTTTPPGDRRLAYRINFCRDGRFPKGEEG